MDINPSSRVDTSLDLNAKPLLQRLDRPAALPASASMEPRNSDIEEELERVRAENRKLTEMLAAMCESYNALRRKLTDYMNSNVSIPEDPASSSKKIKTENNDDNNNNNNNNLGLLSMGVSESSTTEEDSAKKLPTEDHQSTNIRAKVSTVCVRTQISDSSTLVVKDGYQWRKYGQKVTRDNPCPRAYFKCSFAPSCPVKKKVQRSAEDQSMVVATYEGEHNHPPPSHMEPSSSPSSSGRCITIGSAPLRLEPTTRTRPSNNEVEAAAKRARVESSPEVRQYLVEQMASSLTRDADFTAALAAAIKGKMFPSK